MLRPLAALALLATSAPAALQPGQWQVASTPGIATLNGRPLGDLPYTPPDMPDSVCLSPTQARDPAAWLARDVAPGCSFTRKQVAAGRIDLAGTCPPQAPGLARGTVRLSGRFTSTSYTLRFATTNPSENGVMGFTGTVVARRVGACPG